MTSYLAGPSLAAATGTRLDSAAKHIQQCRVSQDHMQELVTFDDQSDADDLIRNKYRYCIHKDELVLGIGRCWAIQTKKYQNSAYPRVLSNLGRLADRNSPTDPFNDAIKMMIYLYHNACNLDERERLIEAFKNGNQRTWSQVFAAGTNGAPRYFEADPERPLEYSCKKMIKYLYDYVPVGYANTLGWAHAHCGDTMTSVHIGGLRTVQNGHFEMFCGDLIQWYWPFERQCFEATGKRKPLTIQEPVGNDDRVMYLNEDPFEVRAGGKWDNQQDAKQRKEFFDRQYGQQKGVEKHVPMIKPFKRDDSHPRIYDWYRVFATAISSARPFEMVDIRISRQAI